MHYMSVIATSAHAVFCNTECVDKRFGEGTVRAYWDVLKKKLNQKCSNKATKLKNRAKRLDVYNYC